MTDSNLLAIAAEQAVLGTILVTRGAAIDVLAIAEPAMFYRPAHRDLAVLLLGMVKAGQPIDEQTVLAEIMRRGLTREYNGGSYLLTLTERAWVPDHARVYAEQVRQSWRLRSAREIAARLTQHLDELTDAEALPEVLAIHHDALFTLEERVHNAVPASAPQLLDLLRLPGGYEWQVEGLLERRDRLILTGYEGHGKSMLLRQIACCLAAGLHPFDLEPIPPARILVVDSENSQRQNARKYRPIVNTINHRIAQLGGDRADWSRFRIEHTMLRLTKADDQAALDQMLTTNTPDVLVLGPLYKLTSGSDMNEEVAAAELTAFLDVMRARHNVTLLIEAHSGHALGPHGERSLRPRGSSLFLGWPEVGMGICRSKEDQSEDEHPQIVRVATWRPGRDDRSWPRYLRRGQSVDLPWVVHIPLNSLLGGAR